MSSLRCSRALAIGAALLKGAAKQQVRQTSRTLVSRRCLSLAASARQQTQVKESSKPSRQVASAMKDTDTLHIEFSNGGSTEMPYVWLRDNCQCDLCFSDGALGRKLLMQDLDVEVNPAGVKAIEGGVQIEWNDGHISEFSGDWLHERAFSPTARALRRNQFAFAREPWGADHTMTEYDYNTLMKDDKALLDWLVTMERKGSAMVKNAPEKDIAGPELIEHIAYVKPSHYGPHSPVINRPNSNNVAFTNAKLGMHNDLAQYEHMPGIIFIHCVKQHIGTGGESVVTDGLHAAEILRKTHPEAFQILTSTDAYFWDKGEANYSWEMPEFYKISRHPILTLNSNKEVCRVSVNNAVRDSYLDLPSHKVKDFYSAMKLFNDILYDNALSFKMESGDLMTLDNVRCLHGREGYEAFSERHIESSYLDWDEARCRRRRLQEELGVAELK